MALADIITRTRGILVGQGLGEKPALRIAASDAAESTSGPTVSFTLATGEAAKVKPGNVLSVVTTDPNKAHVIYVTSTTTSGVTGINGYLGSPAVTGSDSGNLDSAVLAQNATWTDHEIAQAINTVIDTLLWPWVYKMADTTVASPDLVYGQEVLDDAIEEIVAAWQVIGTERVFVQVSRQPVDQDVGTDRLAHFGWINGSTGYYTYIGRLAVADITAEYQHMVALGAAALLLGASLAETTVEATKKDNAEAMAQRGGVGDRLWRDFLTLRANASETLGRRRPQRIYIDRG